MKNFCKKYKIQLVLSGYLIFLGVFVYGGIFATMQDIKEISDEAQRKIIDNEIDKENLAKVPQLASDYAIFSAKENDLRVILEKESEIGFIQSLESLAKETGNEIGLKLIEEENIPVKNIPKKTETPESDKKEIKSSLPYEDYINIQLELKGGYPELMKFLKKLENLNYYVNVVAFDLKKEEERLEKKSNNPFVSSEVIPASGENGPEENQPEEILKSLINLVVYIK